MKQNISVYKLNFESSQKSTEKKLRDIFYRNEDILNTC